MRMTRVALWSKDHSFAAGYEPPHDRSEIPEPRHAERRRTRRTQGAGMRDRDRRTPIGMMLGDFGADVVKIEHPSKGDPLRGTGYQKDGGGVWWKMANRNKRCITLKLGDERGAELFSGFAQITGEPVNQSIWVAKLLVGCGPIRVKTSTMQIRLNMLRQGAF
jgi:hypothetical protein